MEIENQKKSMNKHTHIDGRCQSVTIELVIGDRFVGNHFVGNGVEKHGLYGYPVHLLFHSRNLERPGRDRNSTGSSIMEWLMPIVFCMLSSKSAPKESSQQGLLDGDGTIGTYFQTAVTADAGIVIESNPLYMMIDGLGRTIPPALTAQFAFLVV